MAHYDSDRDGALDALDLRRLVQGVLPAATNAQIVYIRVRQRSAGRLHAMLLWVPSVHRHAQQPYSRNHNSLCLPSG